MQPGAMQQQRSMYDAVTPDEKLMQYVDGLHELVTA